MVIWPEAALAAPPEMGPSTYRMPLWARRASRAMDQLGSTVEHMMKVLPARMAAAAPCSPNSTITDCP